jgi:hypothetical protein
MVSSQLPLVAARPLITSGRYTSRSMVPKRPAFGQVPYVCRMISAAGAHEEADHAVCSGALLFV